MNDDLRQARQEAADAAAEAVAARQEAADALAAIPAPGGGGSAKVSKIALDPGKYDGDKKTFQDCMTKATIWLKVNEKAVPTDFARCIFIWSRLEGSIVGKYTQTRMTQCTNSGMWPGWNALHTEMTATFSPQIERDWARSAIQNLRQGNGRVDDFCARWETLQRQSEVSDEHGVFLLERNTSPNIIQQIFLMGLRKQTIVGTLAEIKKVGRAQESYAYSFAGGKPNQGRAWSNNAQGSSGPQGGAKTYGGQGQPMDIGAADKGKCFNCNGPHLVRDCKLPKVPCGSCKWLGGRHKNDCRQSKGKGRDVRTTETSAPTEFSSGPVKGMDYEAAKAYFQDLLDTEKKHAAASGKGNGH
jgi:hypothetical protein